MNHSAALTILLVLTSCDTGNSTSEPVVDLGNLASVSFGDFGNLVRIICDDAKFDQSQYDEFFTDLPDEDRIPIEERLKQAIADCEWLQPIQANSDKLYKDSTDGLHFPARLYSFHFEYQYGDISQNRQAGYFESSQLCESHRVEFQERGFAPKDCASELVF